jgi:VanZ family protein
MLKYHDVYLTLALALAIMFGAFSPSDELPNPYGTDKILHFFVFSALVFPFSRSGRFKPLPIFIFASVFGGVIEILQPSFERNMEMSDWVADNLGIIFGIWLTRLYRNP